MAARQLELDVTVRQRPSRAGAVLHGIVIPAPHRPPGLCCRTAPCAGRRAPPDPPPGSRFGQMVCVSARFCADRAVVTAALDALDRTMMTQLRRLDRPVPGLGSMQFHAGRTLFPTPPPFSISIRPYLLLPPAWCQKKYSKIWLVWKKLTIVGCLGRLGKHVGNVWDHGVSG